MGTKYSSQAISGYNSAPPSDDASQSESNKVKWSTIKTKLPDPLKTAIEAVNSALVTAFDQSVRDVSISGNTVAGDHNRTIQIASTVTSSITISLGDAATMAAGYIVTVANQSTVACVVDRVTASNTINGTTASVSIASLESITFIVNSTANGYITKSRAGAAAASTVNSFSAGTTGFTPSTATTGAVTLAGTLAIGNGGTNATTAAAARTNLDVPTRGGGDASGTWGISISGQAGTVATVTTSQVNGAIAGSTAGDVGTYGYFESTTTVLTPNSTIAGSSLRWAGIQHDDDSSGSKVGSLTSPSGTWKVMGRFTSPDATYEKSSTLCLRIS